jgi:hypothetical protein
MLIGWMCIGCALREESDRGNSRDIFEKIQNSCSLVTARTQGLRTKLSAERNFIPSLLVQQSPYVQAVGKPAASRQTGSAANTEGAHDGD